MIMTMVSIEEVQYAAQEYRNALSQVDLASPEFLDVTVQEANAKMMRYNILLKMYKEQNKGLGGV